MATEGWIPVVENCSRFACRYTSAIPSLPAVRISVPQWTIVSDGSAECSTCSTTRGTIVGSAYPSSP
jgi:hypothetical protein